MPAPQDQGPDLDALAARIAAARIRPAPARSVAGEKFSAANLAWRMVIELVVGVLMGGAIGWAIDSLLGTLPLGLLVFGMLGFAAGVRTMMRSAAEVTRRSMGQGDAVGTDGDRG